MSVPALSDSEYLAKLEEIGDLMMQGKSKFAIGRALGIKAVEADQYMRHWQDILNDDMAAKDAAKDHLNAMVARYDRLIESANKNLDDLRGLLFDEKVSAQINATLKNIADFDAKRVDALQKAGLLDGADLGDELIEREEREEQILSILKELCPSCQKNVAEKISRLTGQATAVQVDDGPFEGVIIDE